MVVGVEVLPIIVVELLVQGEQPDQVVVVEVPALVLPPALLALSGVVVRRCAAAGMLAVPGIGGGCQGGAMLPEVELSFAGLLRASKDALGVLSYGGSWVMTV